MNGEIEKQVEEGAKGKLGVLITGTAITAFAASSLYVLGLSISIHQSLASHFDILDYIQITPVWALPALVAFLLCALPGILFHFSFLLDDRIRFRFLASLLVFFVILGFVGLGVISFPNFFLAPWPKIWPQTRLLLAADAFVVLGIAGLVFLGSVIFLVHLESDVKSPLGKLRKWNVIISTASTLLCFAFVYGAIVAPALIRAGTDVTVYLKQEGPSIEGRIDLPHADAKHRFNALS